MNYIKDEKPDIIYPANWSYKVIGLTRNSVESAVLSLLEGRKHTLSNSNKSSGGKYISLNLSLIVRTEEERVSLFKNLANHPDIKMVI